MVTFSSEIREDKVPGYCLEECCGSVRVGTETLSQIHGFQGKFHVKTHPLFLITDER